MAFFIIVFAYNRLISACFWLPDFLNKWSLEENNSEADQLSMKEEMKQTEKNDGIMNIDNSSSDIENGEEKSQQAEGENKKDK